jgi:hypothetical protein
MSFSGHNKQDTMNLNVTLYTFEPHMAEHMPEVPNAIFVTEEELGGQRIRQLHTGIFSFNDQCFMAAGEKYENVVAWGWYDFMELQLTEKFTTLTGSWGWLGHKNENAQE